MIIAPRIITALVFTPALAFAEANSTTIPMAFEDCLAAKERTIAQLNVNPRNTIPIVNTSIMTVTRVCTADGSMLITCSKPDRKMIVTQSSHNKDVGCP